jgi:hypothetical protein
MNRSTLKEIERFSIITPAMQSTFNKVVDEWSPEIPPLTIIFAALGDSFIDSFQSIEVKNAEMVFEKIEAMLTGENEELNIGASTGFLEAIEAKTSFSKEAKLMLGKESRSFLRSWREFLGIQDDEL